MIINSFFSDCLLLLLVYTIIIFNLVNFIFNNYFLSIIYMYRINKIITSQKVDSYCLYMYIATIHVAYDPM